MFDLEKARQEVEERNRIRGEARMPLVPVVTELRRIYEFQHEHEFEQFFQTSPLRKRIEEKLLNRQRRLRGEPEWKPTGVLSGGGLAFHARARMLMRRILGMRHRRAGR